MHNYEASQLFMQKFIYLIETEHNWAKADNLISNIPEKVEIPEIIAKILQLRCKLELGKTSGIKKLVQYHMDKLEVAKNEGEILDIMLCNLFDYGFKLLVNECLYDKLKEENASAIFAKKALDCVYDCDSKTYSSHILQIYEKIEKAIAANTSYTSNYILANYLMVMQPFKTKLPNTINAIRNKFNTIDYSSI